MSASPRARRAAALAAVLAFAIAAGCEKSPAPPAHTNPFDPANPATGGDPLRVRAEEAGPGVTLSWVAAAVGEVSGYRVFRRTESEPALAPIDSVGADAGQYLDLSPARDSLNVYLVTAIGARGEASVPTPGARDSIDVPPPLEIRPGAVGSAAAETTSVRAVRVDFFSQRGERVFLSSGPDPLGVRGLAAPESFPPDPAGYEWTLPSGLGPEGVKTVYGRVLRKDGSLSAITYDAIHQNAIRLKVQVDGASADTIRTGRRALTVTIATAVGAESLAVTIDPAPYPAFTPLVPSVVVPIAADSLGRPLRLRPILRVRAKNDFGVLDSVHVFVIVDTLATARILLDGGAAQTPGPTVNVSVTGGVATAICLTNDRSAASCPGAFEAFDGVRAVWPLDPGQVRTFAHVTAFLANEWATTAARVDSIFYLGGAP